MNITYLGHSSFKLQGKDGTVVTDPFEPKNVGLNWNKVAADLVTVSHQHSDHNNLNGIKATKERDNRGTFIINGPGEYEVSNITVQGWATYHDEQSGTARGPNTIYLIELEKIKILHCGDLGHQLSEKIIEEIGQVDVLLIPVGGFYTIDANSAAKITKTISPSIVIPMHYQVFGLNPQVFEKLTGVEAFLKEMEVDTQPLDKLIVSPPTLPENTQVVVLKS
jgi:L-ascorbate metabolism protein UlaG (beta-lactamase superfamily)